MGTALFEIALLATAERSHIVHTWQVRDSEHCHEIPADNLSNWPALRRCRLCRASRGASLSIAAGAHHCRFAAARDRHLRPLVGQWLSERLGQQFVIENRTAPPLILPRGVVRAPPADIRFSW